MASVVQYLEQLRSPILGATTVCLAGRKRDTRCARGPQHGHTPQDAAQQVRLLVELLQVVYDLVLYSLHA